MKENWVSLHNDKYSILSSQQLIDWLIGAAERVKAVIEFLIYVKKIIPVA